MVPEPKVLNRYKLTAEDEGVYIGRPSKWQNPFPVTQALPRGQAVLRFNEWLATQPALIEEAKRELKGKNLICFCAPQSCHGDTWLRLVNDLVDEPTPFERYRANQPLSAYGYTRTRRGYTLSLETLEDTPLIYSDSMEQFTSLLQGETAYRIDFTLQNPAVLLDCPSDVFTLLPKKLTLMTKKGQDALVCLSKTKTWFYARQAALLQPKQQVTAITRIPRT